RIPRGRGRRPARRRVCRTRSGRHGRSGGRAPDRRHPGCLRRRPGRPAGGSGAPSGHGGRGPALRGDRAQPGSVRGAAEGRAEPARAAVSRSLFVALVRHAATEWTAERRVQGRVDHPLSPEGEAQVARWRLPADLGRLQAGGRLGWAVSPLRRALDTAGRLGAVAPVVEPRLLEMDYGRWQGLGYDEVGALTPET